MNDTIYAATVNNLRAYASATSEERWRLFGLSADVGGSPTMVGDTVYLTVRDPDAARNDGNRELVAVDGRCWGWRRVGRHDVYGDRTRATAVLLPDKSTKLRR